MRVKHVRAFGDSQLAVQQILLILEEYQCLEGTLNSYLEKCWGIIHSFDVFNVRHISRVENCRANNLAQEASGYRMKQEKFHNIENLIKKCVTPNPQVAKRPCCQAGLFAIGSDHPGTGSRPFDVARNVLLIDLADNAADAIDWRTPLINYL
jgi:hypothetical protein